LKQPLPRISTDRGIEIDLSEQNAKHSWPIRVNRESDSNAILSNRLNFLREPLKQPLPSTSTDRGMRIDFSEHSAKQWEPIRLKQDSDSKVMLLNGLNLLTDPVKQRLPRA
jgi:hypothetical protein